MRQRVSKSVISLILLLLLTGCSRNWLVYRGQGGSGYTGTAIQPPLGIKWKLLLQDRENKRESFNPPVIFGTTLYFGSGDGNLYALDIRTGYMKWVFRTTGAINAVPTACKEFVYIGSSDGNIYCLDRESGTLVWTFGTKAAVNSTIVLNDEKVYAISDADALYCLDGTDGTLLWSIPNKVWYRNSFQIYDNSVYFSPGPPEYPLTLTGYDINTQEYSWFVDTEDDDYIWYSFPGIQKDSLYYGAAGLENDQWELTFVCINRHTGEGIWQQRDRGFLSPDLDARKLFQENTEQLDYLAPVIYRNKVFFAAGDMKLRAFNRKTGDPLWTDTFSQPVSGAPLVGGNRIFLGLKEVDGQNPGQLVCLNAENGKELWRMEIEGSLLSAPVLSGRWLIFGTDRNLFYVLEEVF